MNVLYSGLRSKSRTTPPVIISGLRQKAYRVTDNALMSDTLVSDFSIGETSENIVYTTKRANLRAKANLCRHDKWSFAYGGGTEAQSVISTTPNPDWRYEYVERHRAACLARAAIISRVKTLDGGLFGSAYLGANCQAYINDAFEHLRPDLTSVQVPNFLVDLLDLKSLFVLWKKKRSIAKNLAGLHLSYNYGWKPTMGDLGGMFEAATKLKEKLSAFKSQIGRKVQANHRIETSTNTVSGTYTHASFPGTATFNAVITRECIGSVTYQPQPLAVVNQLDETIRSFLDALGFELNPRIIWDALPLTFVIDYFFDVGSFLQRYRFDALDLPILLVDGYIQYKETVSIEWSTEATHLGAGFPVKPRSGGATYKSSYFHRAPIYPDFSKLTSMGWKMPKLNQAALLVSLATVLSGKK